MENIKLKIDLHETKKLVDRINKAHNKELATQGRDMQRKIDSLVHEIKAIDTQL